jgi:hypothetical protein
MAPKPPTKPTKSAGLRRSLRQSYLPILSRVPRLTIAKGIQHPPRTTNTERFWNTYNASTNHWLLNTSQAQFQMPRHTSRSTQSSKLRTQSEPPARRRPVRGPNTCNNAMVNQARFWFDRYTRVKPERTQSEPPPRRRPLSSSVMPRATHRAARAFRIVKQKLGGVRQTLWQNINDIRIRANGAFGQGGPRLRMAVKVAVAASVLVVAYQTMNIAHHVKVNHTLPRSVQTTLDQYKHFPTWMYTEPHNILNLETPSIGEIAPERVIAKAWRTFGRRFHPDHWQEGNGFANRTVAGHAYLVGARAKYALDMYYENPYCENSTRSFLEFDALHHVTGLAHFAPNCTCNSAEARRQALDALVPAILQSSSYARLNTESLADLCPCNATLVKSFHKMPVGSAPPLARIYDATSWSPLAPSAFVWKLCTFFMGTLEDWKHANSPERNRWEKEGWSHAQDWLEDQARGCIIDELYDIRYEGKGIIYGPRRYR